MVVVSTGPGGSGVAFHKPGVSGWPSSKVESAGGCTHHKVRQRRQLPEVISHLSPKHRPIEILQQPGDVVFVPALWWHATYDEEPGQICAVTCDHWPQKAVAFYN